MNFYLIHLIDGDNPCSTKWHAYYPRTTRSEASEKRKHEAANWDVSLNDLLRSALLHLHPDAADYIFSR
ncbi:hypothetical protein BOTNAR_0098g00250 [Botryotinia narcissicola]|uniref:Uncharacterized protein n=1 Tax=Botryotinia narcissicola TaxID=278944 RepID=A0A4Z1J3G6_9HELO|nr:hypothetical protein BOTNAR_0098g00250 [Botryotinia narcissicola]